MEKLVRDSFLENQSSVYLWINSLKFYTVCFYCISSWGLSKYIETKLGTTSFYLILNIFSKIKRGLELVSLPHFLHNFWRKIFLLLCSINWRNFIVWLPLFCEILGNMFIAIVRWTGCDVMNCETNLAFLIKPFFLESKGSFQDEIKSIFHHF